MSSTNYFQFTAAGYIIKSRNEHIKHTQKVGQVYHNAFSGEYSSELQSQREILLALLAKYKDLERRSVSKDLL